MQKLTKQFVSSLQEANTIASNSYLTFFKDAVEQVENASTNDQQLSEVRGVTP